jgi:hypothetical protein
VTNEAGRGCLMMPSGSACLSATVCALTKVRPQRGRLVARMAVADAAMDAARRVSGQGLR